MSAPRIITQLVFTGSQILGRAFAEAFRQARRNMRPQTGSEGGATARGAGGSRLGGLDATHEMTLDEAAQILNVKKQQLIEESEVLKMLKNFDHLFSANAPLREGKPHSSHYLQSKIVRAKERLEAEFPDITKHSKPQQATQGEGAATSAAGEAKDAAGRT